MPDRDVSQAKLIVRKLKFGLVDGGCLCPCFCWRIDTVTKQKGIKADGTSTRTWRTVFRTH